MRFKTLSGLSLSVLYMITALIISNNAQSSGAVFVGRMGGLDVQVQGDKALFSNNELIHDYNPLSLAMKNKGIEKIAIEPDKIEIHQYKNHFPDIIHFPLLIEPTPTATGIKSIDQTRGLQLLNNSVLSLATTLIDKTVVLPTPTLSSSPMEDSAKTISHSEIELYQETQNTFYATASIPMLPPVSSVASEGDYIDLEFETSDTIRVYPKAKDSDAASGFFERIIIKAADSPEKKTDNDNGGQQEQQAANSSAQNDDSNSDETTSGAETASTSTPQSEASALGEKTDGTPETPLPDKFHKYHSIEDSTNENVVSAIRAFIEENDEHDLPWVVLEKIHGTNYTLWTDGTIVKAGKRTEWLSENDNFYNHRPVYEQYREMILDMHRKFCKEGDILNVTGELYGKSIQKQIFYQDDVKFAAFDIFVNNWKIDYHTFKEWTSASGIPTVAELKICDSFEEAFSFNPVFPSQHSQTNDVAEGVVIKPVRTKLLKYKRPVILKIKNPKFAETNLKKVSAEKNNELSEDNQELLNLLLAKVTKNRFYTVASKLEKLTESNINRFKAELSRDIFAEYERENGITAKDKVKDKKQLKIIQTDVFKAINKLLKDQIE
ncbi:RNA ligase family protein [Endozoicomonas sp. 4G]|uniref:RNA ligase family protein n=1 Tax=Endozoicomonas sp. 4G TaxID=2872754 RepID=UPI00207892EC|nr:RNA ligase family protein [Endozoicomonas sp. 4G]